MIKIDWTNGGKVSATVTIGVGKVIVPDENAVSLAPHVEGLTHFYERLLREGRKGVDSEQAFTDVLNSYFQMRVLDMIGLQYAQLALEGDIITGLKPDTEVEETGYRPGN